MNFISLEITKFCTLLNSFGLKLINLDVRYPPAIRFKVEKMLTMFGSAVTTQLVISLKLQCIYPENQLLCAHPAIIHNIQDFVAQKKNLAKMKNDQLMTIATISPPIKIATILLQVGTLSSGRSLKDSFSGGSRMVYRRILYILKHQKRCLT